MPTADTLELIRQRLGALEPQSLDLADESAAHAGHAGAASGGGHYRLTLVSPRFRGLDVLARHRLVYAALGDLMSTRIHALRLTTFSPEEL